jgi:hypothetical protein
MSNSDTVFTLPLLLWSVADFALMMVLHVLIWRVFKVRKQILWLFLIFLGLPTAVFLIGLVRGQDPTAWALWYLLEFTLSSCYILFFPAVQSESPTLTLVRQLDRHKRDGGLSRERILAAMSTNNPILDRLTDLQNNGLIQASGGPQRLSGPGRLVAIFFFYYRRAMGLPSGEG